MLGIILDRSPLLVVATLGQTDRQSEQYRTLGWITQMRRLEYEKRFISCTLVQSLTSLQSRVSKLYIITRIFTIYFNVPNDSRVYPVFFVRLALLFKFLNKFILYKCVGAGNHTLMARQWTTSWTTNGPARTSRRWTTKWTTRMCL